MDVARLAARVAIGGLFVGHGTQKLFGWFGGPGLEGTQQMMDSLSMHPPRRNALAAGVTEAGSGLLLATGLATPLAASGLIGVMTTAIRKVHIGNGVWNSGGGYEFNLTLIAAAAALAETGPGDLSLDHLLGTEMSGTGWALAAVALGVGVSAATIEMGRRAAAAAPPKPTPPGADAGPEPAGSV